MAGSAYTYANELVAWRNPETDYDAKMLGQADRAIALAPDNLWAYYVKCVYLYYSHRADEAIDAADAGLAINPNFGPFWGVRGNANPFLAGSNKPNPMSCNQSGLVRAIRSGQSRPSSSGDAELGLGHFDAAIDEYHKGSTSRHAEQYVALRKSGRRKCARGQDGRRQDRPGGSPPLKPKLTMKSLIPLAPPISNLFDGLRKAGMPEVMSETRKIAAILVADVVGYSRLAGANEERTLARLRALRSDLIDPAIAVHHGRIVKRTGDGVLIEFRSVVDAVRCAIEVTLGAKPSNASMLDGQRPLAREAVCAAYRAGGLAIKASRFAWRVYMRRSTARDGCEAESPLV